MEVDGGKGPTLDADSALLDKDSESDSDAESRERTARRLRRQEIQEKSLLDSDNEEDSSAPVTRSSPRADQSADNQVAASQPATSQPAASENQAGEEPAVNTQATPILVEITIVNNKGTLSPNLDGGGGGLLNATANPSGAAMANPNPSGGKLFGQSDAMNSSYESISAMKISSRSNPTIVGGGAAVIEKGEIGIFANKGDNRSAICHFRASIEKKQMISFSFDPKALSCSTCLARGEHFLLGGGGARQTFVLSDQNFPGNLPVGDGECLKVIKVENGSLSELVSTFLATVGGREIPAGSVLLIFSASHLMLRGLPGYIQDLTDQLEKLDRISRGGLISIPGVPILIGGTQDRFATRQIIEFGAWMRTTGESFLVKTWVKLVETIMEDCYGGTYLVEKSKPLLPDLIRNPTSFRTWVSEGWASPRGVQPFTEQIETELIALLIKELNDLFNVGLGRSPSHSRLIEDTPKGPLGFLLVGGSHTKREGDQLAERGFNVVTCSRSGWRPVKGLIADMAAKLENALKMTSGNTVIVCHMFDNVTYMCRTEDGGDLPIWQYPNGEFHVQGDLVLASKERLNMFFRNSLPILKQLEGKKVIFITPLPRYLYNSCCNNEDHAPNRTDIGFEDDMKRGLAEVRGYFKDFLFSSGLRGFKIINPGICIPELDEEGENLWGEDPVHPLYAGYEKLVDTIVEEAATLRLGKNARKRPGEALGGQGKRLRQEAPRPQWIEQQSAPVMTLGGPFRGQQRGRGHFRGPFRGRGTFRGRGERRGEGRRGGHRGGGHRGGGY